MKHVEALRVMMWGRQVGAVALDPQTNHYAFGYDPKWIRAGGPSLSPRYMPLSETAVYVFPSLNEETYKRLPSAIADSLPDRFGNALIDEYMAGKGVAKSDVTELDRLAYLGSRAMGALEFKPELRRAKGTEEALQMNSLVQAAREAIKGSFAGDKAAQKAIRELIEVGTS
ncbi:MAG: HipA N-terminal domain-containing protein, partial [Rhodoferax sp.]|nr:HipA N-terminal domain-containing protein [Rhodoferax sp.]